MSSQYFAVLTSKGQQLITEAYQNGTVVNVTQMAFGDAGLTYVKPDPAMTALVNQIDIKPIERRVLGDNLIAGGINISSEDYPGKWVYELGLFDEDNNLIVYGAYPPSAVPQTEDQVEKLLSVDFGIVLSSTDNISIVIDPTTEYLTRAVADTLYFKLDQNFAELDDEQHGDESKTAARGHLGLGSAAVVDVTESNRDSTAGRVIKVSDYGIGRTIGTVATGIDFKSFVFIQGEHLFVKMDTCTNIPAGLNATSYYFISVHGVRDSDGSPGVMFVNYSNPTEVWIGYGAGAAGSRTWSMSRLLNTSGFEMAGAITVNGEGHGSYASQNGNKAPLYQLINSASASEYWPMVKQKYTQGNSTWSMGRIVNGDAMVVHYVSAADPNGKTFYFNKDGTFAPPNWTNFDARYQAKGNYVTGVRLGASKDVTNGGGGLADQSGYVVTMGGDFGSNDGYYRLRPIQYLVNGSWINSVSA